MFLRRCVSAKLGFTGTLYLYLDSFTHKLVLLMPVYGLHDLLVKPYVAAVRAAFSRY